MTAQEKEQLIQEITDIVMGMLKEAHPEDYADDLE